MQNPFNLFTGKLYRRSCWKRNTVWDFISQGTFEILHKICPPSYYPFSGKYLMAFIFEARKCPQMNMLHTHVTMYMFLPVKVLGIKLLLLLLLLLLLEDIAKSIIHEISSAWRHPVNRRLRKVMASKRNFNENDCDQRCSCWWPNNVNWHRDDQVGSALEWLTLLILYTADYRSI